jgi:hypothetical protein
LHLHWKPDESVTAALGLLLHLQDLELKYAYIRDRNQRLSLPCSLTRLHVEAMQDFTSSSTPDLASLTALQHLHLEDIADLDPSLLSSLAQLTHLQVQLRTFDRQPCLDFTKGLMCALPQLSRLQHLALSYESDTWSGSSLSAVPFEQCGALTSSSHLTCLELNGVRLPGDCGSQLFGKMMPHLKVLELNGTVRPRPDLYARTECVRSMDYSPKSFGRVEDVRSMVCNCPNLRVLHIAGAVQGGVDLCDLRLVSGLTALEVGGVCADDVCAAGLGQLSGLRSLAIYRPAPNIETDRGHPVHDQSGSDDYGSYDSDDVGGSDEKDAAVGANGGGSDGSDNAEDADAGVVDDGGDAVEGGAGHADAGAQDLGGYEDGACQCDEFRVGGVPGSFTFTGLRSLMQLTSLTTLIISKDTCLHEHEEDRGYGHSRIEAATFVAPVSTSFAHTACALATLATACTVLICVQ